MLIPIRCYTCGKPIGHLYETVQSESKGKASAKQALDKLGVERPCCRAALIASVDLQKQVGVFKR